MHTTDSYYQTAKQVISKYHRDMRDANALARRAHIVERHAICRETKTRHELASVSLNDILESAEATGLLVDPVTRAQLLRVSSILNGEIERF